MNAPKRARYASMIYTRTYGSSARIASSTLRNYRSRTHYLFSAGVYHPVLYAAVTPAPVHARLSPLRPYLAQYLMGIAYRRQADADRDIEIEDRSYLTQPGRGGSSPANYRWRSGGTSGKEEPELSSYLPSDVEIESEGEPDYTYETKEGESDREGGSDEEGDPDVTYETKEGESDSGDGDEQPRAEDVDDPREWWQQLLDWMRKNPAKAAALTGLAGFAADYVRNLFVDPAVLRSKASEVVKEIAAADRFCLAASLDKALDRWVGLVTVIFGSKEFAAGSIGAYFDRASTRKLLAAAPTKASIAAQVDDEYDYYLTQEWWPIAKLAGMAFIKPVRIAIWHGAVIEYRSSLTELDRAEFDRRTNNDWV